MVFEAITTPKDILELQNNIESIFVANVLARRRLAIGEALSKADKVSDLPKLIDTRAAIRNGLDFVWQQGLAAGIAHAEKEIGVQMNKSTNFSLSYGVTEILEFARRRKSSKDKQEERLNKKIKELDGQIERSAAVLRNQDRDTRASDVLVAAQLNKDVGRVTDQERQDFYDNLVNEVQDAISQREVLTGQLQTIQSNTKERTRSRKRIGQAVETDAPENSREAELQKKRKREATRLRAAWERRERTVNKLSKLNTLPETRRDLENELMNRIGITTQQEILNTLNNRYTALSPASSFAQTYLNRRQTVLTQNESSIVQDDVKRRVAEFVEENKTETNQKRLLTELGDMYRGASGREYDSEIRSLSTKSDQIKRSNQLSQEDLFNIQNDLADVNEELEEAIKEFRRRRRRGTTLSDDDREYLSDLRKQRAALRSEERDIRIKRNRKEDQLENSIKTGRLRSDAMQKEIGKLESLLDSSDKKILNAVYPNLPASERDDKALKEAKKLLRGRLRDQKKMSKQVDKRLSRQERELNNGDFTVSQAKGNTTQLSGAEQARISKLLKLIQPDEVAALESQIVNASTPQEAEKLRRLLNRRVAEVEKLDQPMTSAALGKLRDRLKRRRDVFNDEGAAQSATRLAATEVSAAYNLGRLQVFANKGIRYVQWIATIDSKTSVFCQSLHRKVFLLEDVLAQIMFAKSFPKTRKSADDVENKRINPGGIWVPPAHPYCRSYLQPIYLKEDEVKVKQDIKDAELAASMALETEIEKEGAVGVRKLQKEHAKKKERLKKAVRLGNTLFTNGLGLLLRRLKQEGIAQLTVDEVRQNDTELTAALLGGAAALSASSLVYFFLKSNLAEAITAYTQHVMSDVYEGGKEFLANMTKADAAKVLKEITDEIKALPPSVLEEFKIPLDLEKLQTPEFELERLAKRGEAGFGLAMDGIPVDDAVESLLTSNQLQVNSGKAFKNKVYREVLNKTSSEVSALRKLGMSTMNESLGDLGFVASRIEDIEELRLVDFRLDGDPRVINVVFKKGKGRPTLISARKFNQALESRGFNQQMGDIGERSRQLEKVLEDLQRTTDESDTLLRSRIAKELNTVRRLSGLTNKMKGAKGSIGISQTRETFTDLFEENSKNINTLNDFNAGIETISDAADDIIKEFAENLPPSEILNAVADNMSDLTELKSLQEVIDASLENIERRFLKSTKGKFKPKEVQDLSDIGDTLTRLKQSQDELVNSALTIEFKPTLDRINKVVGEQILNDYNILQRQKLEVSKRIKQLE